MNQSYSDDYEPWRGDADNAPADHVERDVDPLDGGPGRHDRDLIESPEADLAPCPDCRKMLSAHATECHHCGMAFGCEVWQYGDSRRSIWGGRHLKYMVVLILLIFFFWLLSATGYTPF